MRAIWLFICCNLIIVSMFVELAICGKARHFNWTVEYLLWSPDGHEGMVIGINGQFPGPTIRAHEGDIIHVNLKNGLGTEGVVIHWHGIRQIGTPWADGTASISQCAIDPGETFPYRFKVDKRGTYFYHAHYGMQRSAGLYGMLIVDVAKGEREIIQYDAEFHLLLSDWWHKPTHEQEVDLSSKPMRWIGEPQSLLINGRGQYNCSLAAAYVSNSSVRPCMLRGDEQYAPDILHVQPNKTYRLRIASTTSLASLNLAIGNHNLVVVEADGNYVEPFSVPNMDIYSGESYSVLFTTDQNPAQNYWISLDVRARKPNTPQGLTILNYHPTSPSKLPISPPPVPPLWNDFNYSKSFTKKILARQPSPRPPRHPHRTIHLLNTQNLIDGYTKWAINNVSLVLPTTPYLGAIKHNVNNAFDRRRPHDRFGRRYNVMIPAANQNATYGNGVYTFAFNTTIDVILQNANALRSGDSEIHPWHLHGHDFWVLGYGEGRFRSGDEERFNLESPPLRNTAVIFPFGWTALRFVADNPGVWAFHCHIEPHLHMGMGVVFAEGVRRVGEIPKEAMGCGLTGKMLMNNGRH
ncbi:hypothetical protein CASFOL_034137 [Castilleja foliolosa]|uniref:L-ascorbate oxidase n=1 Tax=Castilleja foliolosa TaxID=1961234 RepID=A0ABD3BYC3_9LAMI